MTIRSVSCNLPEHIAERQMKRAMERLDRLFEMEPKPERPNVPAQGKGTYLAVFLEYAEGRACYAALGAIGKPAEKVADESCRAAREFLPTEAVMDEYMADQILLPLALVPEESEYTTPCVTPHLLTNAEVIRQFVPAEIAIEGEAGQPGRVRVRGVANG